MKLLYSNYIIQDETSGLRKNLQMNPEYYYVWGATWDSYNVDIEYTYRPDPTDHAQYVVLNEEQAIILKLTFPNLKLKQEVDEV
jgi:hypothetical protein